MYKQIANESYFPNKKQCMKKIKVYYASLRIKEKCTSKCNVSKFMVHCSLLHSR